MKDVLIIAVIFPATWFAIYLICKLVVGINSSAIGKRLSFAGNPKLTVRFLNLCLTQVLGTLFAWLFVYEKYDVFKHIEGLHALVVLREQSEPFEMIFLALIALICAVITSGAVSTFVSLVVWGDLLCSVVMAFTKFYKFDFVLYYLVALAIAAVCVTLQNIGVGLVMKFFSEHAPKENEEIEAKPEPEPSKIQ